MTSRNRKYLRPAHNVLNFFFIGLIFVYIFGITSWFLWTFAGAILLLSVVNRFRSQKEIPTLQPEKPETLSSGMFMMLMGLLPALPGLFGSDPQMKRCAHMILAGFVVAAVKNIIAFFRARVQRKPAAPSPFGPENLTGRVFFADKSQ